ncbi:hypothetical protein VUR80DRAFT_8697 [Thermomyces stellatus]
MVEVNDYGQILPRRRFCAQDARYFPRTGKSLRAVSLPAPEQASIAEAFRVKKQKYKLVPNGTYTTTSDTSMATFDGSLSKMIDLPSGNV